MTESFLIFTSNPPNISRLNTAGKSMEWKKMTRNLQNILDNYQKNDLTHQEMKLFNFLDETFEEMTPSHLHKTIKKFMDKITDDMKENGIKMIPISYTKEKSELTLNYGNIIPIVYIIKYILENIVTKGKTSDAIYDFIYKDKIPEFKEKKEQQISQLIKLLNTVKTLNICLYTNPKDIYYKKKEKQAKTNTLYMEPKIVFFFGLFYKAFFKNITSINYNLNIFPIDNYFRNNNPYLVNEEQILLKGKEYKDIIICNLILIKTLQKFQYSTNVNFRMYDSYQLELHNVLTEIFNVDINNDIMESNVRKLTLTKISGQKVKNLDIKKSIMNNKQRTLSMALEENPNFIYSPKFNNNYLYFQHLLNLKENSFFDLTFDFNSLDPLLFTSVNYSLIKFTCISKLNLILFPHNKFNKRKTTLNNFFYRKYLPYEDLSNNYSIDDQKIYYQYLDNTENNTNQNNFILKDEKLLNELFHLFNRNLINLSIILEKKINDLLTLSIDFSTYNNESISLCNYDNYNCAIVCFIFNLLKTLQSQIDKCQLKNLEIFYEDFFDEKTYVVETINKKIPSAWKDGFQLNELKLNHINLNISNISLILPFQNFPSINLMELIVSNLSYNDLNNMINAFNTKKDIFPVLVKLDISLGIFIEDYSEPLEILLKDCLSRMQQLKFFALKLPFIISTKELIDIIYWIKLNHNNDLNIALKIINEEFGPSIGKDYYIHSVTDCFDKNKEYLKEKNLIIDYNTYDDNKTIKLGINKYQKEELNYYYNFVYCLQKFNDKLKDDNNKRIFENIFGFRGKFKKYYINIEVNE